MDLTKKRDILQAWATMEGMGVKRPASWEPDIALAVWQVAFKDTDRSAFLQGVSRWLAETDSPWWPVPGEIRKLVPTLEVNDDAFEALADRTLSEGVSKALCQVDRWARDYVASEVEVNVYSDAAVNRAMVEGMLAIGALKRTPDAWDNQAARAACYRRAFVAELKRLRNLGAKVQRPAIALPTITHRGIETRGRMLQIEVRDEPPGEHSRVFAKLDITALLEKHEHRAKKS